MTGPNRAIAVVSGGLDSTTLVYDLIDYGYEVDMVSFNYGQRHKKELAYAANTADRLGLRHNIVELGAITGLLGEGGSSLVSDTAVPHGHYAADNMAATIVPNRNMIMLAITAGIAVARGITNIATGVHAGDHAIYPDCRPEFVDSLEESLRIANDEPQFTILAPYIRISKAEIAVNAITLGVPLNSTWSCYEGGDFHCGKCGTCVERLEAIDEAFKRRGLPNSDETHYVDSEFWKETVGA